jgi:hypothetical protein
MPTAIFWAPYGAIDQMGDPLAEAGALGRGADRCLPVQLGFGSDQNLDVERTVRLFAPLGALRQIIVEAAREGCPQLCRVRALEVADVL